MINRLKIVVFDMDETLGYFLEFGIFWQSLKRWFGYELSSDFFNKTLDLYPEFIRPNIMTVLNYLKIKKQSNECKGVMIYTNNQESREWVHLITSYFESNLNYKLFDNVICAYKINNTEVELCRSCHNKTHRDFVNCTKIPQHTQICFIDNKYHVDMHNQNVYYIKVNTYTYHLKFDEMLHRFVNSGIECVDLEAIKLYMNEYYFIDLKKSQSDYDLDKRMTKKIMLHLQDFFRKKYQMTTPKKTKRLNTKAKKTNKTKKVK